ncbi:MAG: phosphotransferase enzyme family protein [Phycicoccus sp.]
MDPHAAGAGSRVVFDDKAAHQALDLACRRARVGSTGAQLVRLGENAVFTIDTDIVARVARPHADVAELRRLVHVARWLHEEQVPAVRTLDVDQPVQAGASVVTFWRSLGVDPQYGSAHDLAVLLRQLHHLTPPHELGVPTLQPFERAERRLGVVPISDEDRAFLRDRLDDLRGRYAAVDFALPAGVIHGDASVGNVLLDEDGTPTMIDLDSVAIGPREWDLVLTAVFYERFGWHTDVEYADFVETYGYDVMAWPGYQVLADIRELIMVTWIAQRADESDKLADEVARRIHDLRTNGSRRGWHPY